ncbi:type I-E CRISPR-associated protein Cas7/Cse4/CasC [Pseudoflavonifractor sp. MSJ-37]|uniref:type I-E CRISPR-associated protein Cas7/Cse4/CasC n=1 Tax=Pseudoflavonifractor sp. MSJ-37 TaxID=2841531 RepID=UPI001C1053BD|nr:type I-E CRISPR-associated protein Cas7/Cse4/CasC [Pseudoflavonifractor sp. MSJ-37]MBU5434215.1 type I-E CRISPR-associated protein Cas7/Cse4/CasC [Pseudoflavonifractor sp. MSJ-37]
MRNDERLYVDIHVLQTVPPSCVNRDDTGSPKTAVYGGVTRARVSSQAWKRAMRLKFREMLSEGDVSQRTKMVVDLIAAEIIALSPDCSEKQAQSLGRKVLEAAGIKIKEDKEKLKTGALFFISPSQVHALAAIALREGDGKFDKAECQAALKSMPGVDLALFGRMVADDPCLNYDAAAQVAHAISTHAVENEYDYFTAVDDCFPEDNAGAGHLGTVEFNSSTLYRYATVNVGELEGMLGGKTPEAVKAFLEAFIRSMPTGKQNTFANWTRPDAVYVTVRRDQPINLAGAFEKPVRAGNEGHVGNSIHALVEYAKETYADFASAPVLALTVGKGMEGLGEPHSVDELLDALEAWLNSHEAQG